MEVIDKTKLEDTFYSYLKKHWGGWIDRKYDNLYPNKFLAYGNWKRIAKIHFIPTWESYNNNKFDVIEIAIQKDYVNHKNLKNVLKNFENNHEKIKLKLEIVNEVRY